MNDDILELRQVLTPAHRSAAVRGGGARRVGTLVDSVRDCAIFSLDSDGVIDFWNAGAEHLFGWTATEVRGQHFRIVFPSEDQARGVAEENMAIARREGQAADERSLVTKQNARFLASGVLTALYVGDSIIGYVKVTRDLTQRKLLEAARDAARAELEASLRVGTSELARLTAMLEAEVLERHLAEREVRRLLGGVLAAHEEERRRIAHDIHDQLGQSMTALKLNIEALEARFSSDAEFATEVKRTMRLVSDLDRHIDFLTSELRPTGVEHIGLSAALAELASTWSDRFGVRVECRGSVWEAGLSRDAEQHLYRLVQEALHNVAKHAAATRVSIVLKCDGRDLTLVIEDNGRGFVEAAVPQRVGRAGLGLESMRERAKLVGGELRIESSPGGGTSLSVRVSMSCGVAESGVSEL